MRSAGTAPRPVTKFWLFSDTPSPPAKVKFFVRRVTLFLHCHIPAHDKVGMVGKLIVGKGGEMKTISQLGVPSSVAKSFQGTGTVVAALPRAGRLIVNHDEIQGFMAAMEMSYAVTPPSLLNRLNAGDKIRFTLDAAKSAVTSMDVINSAK